MSTVSYEHRLHPRTDANLTAAILSVGSLLGVSPIADSILEHLKDRIGDTLSPAQRLDPLSVYATDLLSRMTEYVKETYGLDRPANLHAAPQGPHAKEAPIGSDSVFALDGLGRNRFEQLTSATSGSYARMVADTVMSSAAYSAMTVWNPSSGAAGLNEFNFGGTLFAQNGLDLGTTKYLYGQGFNQSQILAAAQDTKALGFSPKDREAVRDHAIIRARDPEADETNRRLKGLQGRLAGNEEYQALAEQWRVTDDTVERARIEKLMRPYEDEAIANSGVQERLDDPNYDPQAKAAVERRTQAILDAARNGNELRTGIGNEAANEASLDSVLKAQDPVAGVAFDGIRAAVVAQVGPGQPENSRSSDQDNLGGEVQSSEPTADPSTSLPTAADDMDDFGVVSEPATDTAASGADGEEQLAQAETPPHPGKEEDDKITEEPAKPKTQVANAPLHPPHPSA